jgi:AraC family transcriptional regulator, arabinose operon regulatory protein
MARSEMVGSVASVTQNFGAESRIQEALKLVQRTPGVNMTHVARSVNLSNSRFRHLFKQKVGVSPLTFVKLMRLERARQLLQTSFLRVKEVAALVGANDMSHFSRDYKRLYGQTPSQTRTLSGKRPTS